MPASSSTLTPPLASGVARLGFGELPLPALKARYGHPASGSRYVELDGFAVHYRDEGHPDKPAVVMMHGVVASLHTWDGWVKAFSPHYRVIRFDLPCFGLTGPAPGAYSEERMRKVLGLLLDHLRVERAILVGNSLGGYLAWSYALEQPERVERLVLLDPVGYPMRRIPWMIAAASLPGATWAMPLWMPRALIAQGVKEVYGDRSRIQPGVPDRYYELTRRPGNRRAMMEIFRLLVRLNRSRRDTPERVARIGVPTLLMWGDRDRWIAPEQVALWKRDLPGLQVRVYAGVGHVPMEEIPERSALDALNFLGAKR
ncbi:MAG TPA: alpha/beta hydrolase [Pseudomonas sp.]|jgi:pimeloyl-ACP methyl ester carboxylesterase|uniref:alpha/beta fold hydrolase n=1 Tax=Pseudomonas sp. TaxID=306 RepID=UPI002C26A7C8|nr:alpha/beta hydrolase [Pseudomonas sp.]HTO20310.1 alpha/beta hydrolase [Pseudomonas sp.]